jgi:hypothetical protein
MEACRPSDIDGQIALLEKYKRTRFDILGNLDDGLASKVLEHISIPDLLGLRLASQISLSSFARILIALGFKSACEDLGDSERMEAEMQNTRRSSKKR